MADPLRLAMKGMNATQIHADLVDTFKHEAVHYSTVTWYLRTPSFSASTDPGPTETPPPKQDELDEAILLALGEEPFASVRSLARATHLSQTTVYRRLTQNLGFPPLKSRCSDCI
jgi:hypothetical protein